MILDSPGRSALRLADGAGASRLQRYVVRVSSRPCWWHPDGRADSPVQSRPNWKRDCRIMGVCTIRGMMQLRFTASRTGQGIMHKGIMPNRLHVVERLKSKQTTNSGNTTNKHDRHVKRE